MRMECTASVEHLTPPLVVVVAVVVVVVRVDPAPGVTLSPNCYYHSHSPVVVHSHRVHGFVQQNQLPPLLLRVDPVNRSG